MNTTISTNEKSGVFLSVVMPVYNGEQYLAKSIDSVLSQTHSFYEFIIINDGSKDGSDAIIQKYQQQDSRIRYINLNRNAGISNALNVGIEAARGKYIARMDCDDIITPDRFSKQLEYLQKHAPEVDVLGSYFCLFNENYQDKCTTVPAHADDFHNGKSPVHHPTCMIKREIFAKYGRYNSKYDNAEDVELWFRWFSQGVRFNNLPEVLYKKRIHEGCVSLSRIKHQIYLLLKINIIAITKYRIRFTVQGYLYVLEQFLYLLYLSLGLDRLYVKDKTNHTIKRKAEISSISSRKQ